MIKQQKPWHYLFWLMVVIIFISPLVYWLTGLGQMAHTLSAEIVRLPDGMLASSSKAEALHSLRLPMRLERMIIYPVLLIAFQLSGGAIALRQQIDTRIQPWLAYRIPKLGQLFSRIGQRIPLTWRERLGGRDLLIIILFIGVLNLTIYLLYLPFNYYRGFIVPHQFGLANPNHTTFRWLSDWGKQVVLTLSVEGTMWFGFFALMRLIPKRWPLVAGALSLVAAFVLTILMPVIVTPLFYTVRPLADADLHTRILTLAERAGTLVDHIDVIDASTKTNQVNAYFTGVGDTRRIVLYDTLLTGYTADEVEVVLAHELGHWYYRHTLVLVLAMGAVVWIALYVLKRILHKSWQWLGLTGPADVAGLPYILAIVAIATSLSLPAQNLFSRYGEGQADEFALTVSQKPAAFIALFEQFAEQNLSIVQPPTWEKYLFYTHPPVNERIQRAKGMLAD